MATKKTEPRRQALSWEQIDRLLTICREARLHVLIYGPPGTGKTFAARTSGVAPHNVYAVNLTQETSAGELRGYDRFVNGEFVFTDGPCIRAWRAGARLVIDEIGYANGEAFSFLLGALDDVEVASTLLPDGTSLRPTEGFHVVATANIDDPAELPAALRDRFAVTIEVIEPHPAAVASLSPDLRHAALNGAVCPDPERRLSVRPWLAFDRLRRLVPEPFAAAAVFGSAHRDVLNALEVFRSGGTAA